MSQSYCRDVESYLCRRNQGHLVRIVGPAFELVCGWEQAGIPLSVVYGAIDRTVERREAKGGNRRPVRIEFCEADVRDLFDEWRRAVGVHRAADAGDPENRPRARRPSLATHLERVVTGLTVWQGSVACPASVRELTGRVVGELDSLRTRAKTARGEARDQLLARLREVEGDLVGAAWVAADEALQQRVRAQAERDLAPYRDRMPSAEFARSLEASTRQLFRDELKLPRMVP